MYLTKAVQVLLPFALLEVAVASPIEARASSSKCPTYTLINARGTGEPQGESAGFTTMNSNVQSALSGGTIYNVVYPASYDQDSSAGTTDIVNKVHSLVSSNPNACVILQGYSQGAAAVVAALPMLTGTSFNAVKGVVLLGDPDHKAGLACNVDNNGGTTTLNVNGLEAGESPGIPSNYVSITRDICIYGDGVCDTTHGYGVDEQHLEYPSDAPTQRLGTSFIEAQLS